MANPGDILLLAIGTQRCRQVHASHVSHGHIFVASPKALDNSMGRFPPSPPHVLAGNLGLVRHARPKLAIDRRPMVGIKQQFCSTWVRRATGCLERKQNTNPLLGCPQIPR